MLAIGGVTNLEDEERRVAHLEKRQRLWRDEGDNAKRSFKENVQHEHDGYGMRFLNVYSRL